MQTDVLQWLGKPVVCDTGIYGIVCGFLGDTTVLIALYDIGKIRLADNGGEIMPCLHFETVDTVTDHFSLLR